MHLLGIYQEQTVWVTSEDKGVCVPACWHAVCSSGGQEGAGCALGWLTVLFMLLRETTEDFLKEDSDFSAWIPGRWACGRIVCAILGPEFWAFFLPLEHDCFLVSLHCHHSGSETSPQIGSLARGLSCLLRWFYSAPPNPAKGFLPGPSLCPASPAVFTSLSPFREAPAESGHPYKRHPYPLSRTS